jgi:peptidoglycan/LPS O-acetylase OafA/YrhL
VEKIESLTAKTQGSKHLPELQSLRGLAAVTVLLHHSTFYYAHPQWFRQLSETILNAHAAIVVFFVLSGYVLQLSLQKSRLTLRTIFAFYVRRAWRIYPALFAASIFAFAYCFFLHGKAMPPSVSSWWESSWRLNPIRPLHIFAAALGVGGALPLPTWTLAVEIFGSILMPLTVALTRLGKIASLAQILLLTAVSFWRPAHFSAIFIFEVDFALGASIFQFQHLFRQLTSTDKRACSVGLIALAGLIFIRKLGPWGFEVDYNNSIAADLEALFATFLVAIIASRPSAFRLLSGSQPIWVGDISYSLYLFHFPMMAFIAAIGGEYLSFSPLLYGGISGALFLMMLTLVFTLAVSACSYRFIELPGLTMGKRLAGRINSSVA